MRRRPSPSHGWLPGRSRRSACQHAAVAPSYGHSARPSRAAGSGLRRLGFVQLDDHRSGGCDACPRRARLRPERRPRRAVRGARAGLLPAARARRAARRPRRDRPAACGGQLRSRRPRPRRPDRRDAGQSPGRGTPGRRGGRAATAGLADGTCRRAGSAPPRSRRPYGGPHGRALRPRHRAHDHQGRRGRSRSRPLRRDRVLGRPEPGRATRSMQRSASGPPTASSSSGERRRASSGSSASAGPPSPSS